jgi:hypothetical protein
LPSRLGLMGNWGLGIAYMKHKSNFSYVHNIKCSDFLMNIL